MSAIGPGTRVKCVWRGPQWPTPGGFAEGPEFGSVWTVRQAAHLPGLWLSAPTAWLLLSEWPTIAWFNEKCFRPLAGDDPVERMRLAALKPHNPDKTLVALRDAASRLLRVRADLRLLRVRGD